MIEVFKTDVRDAENAKLLVDRIHRQFDSYRCNFDLADCDNILRVLCTRDTVEAAEIIEFLRSHGFTAEVLPDEL
ncbi:hypothetical protein OI18_05585 [Flavihumibacter solisilvae]|jgi:hypothetical protein|uniref:Methyltransferase type 11 n=2 Tax=Flavihumibacter solisilvae TaxID=1349421 RepID=A0A0C1INC7_9BACT|nr:hypothetical protein OI18_05585 [Flavihumibacter solisilvae]